MTIELPLLGSTAMVTGSSSGIGRAIAIELARHGADVIIHGRSDSASLRSTRESIIESGRRCETIYADFSHSSIDEPFDWDRFVGQAWDWNGSVDFWINNAGADVLTGSWADRPFESKLNHLWQVDVVASLRLSQRAGERMKQNDPSNGKVNGKVILNTGWDQAWQGMAGPAGELFSTTKGAIMSMSKSLAQSLAPNVRVNCIAPGWIKTQWGEQSSEYWSERALDDALMGRWGTPDDVANVAAFLCSPSASFISGQIIPVNGGFRYGPASKTKQPKEND